MPLSVKNQSVESSGITKNYREAICEYIWNSFEANATEVRISYTLNTLQGIDTIVVSDNGEGIPYENLSDTFGAFLTSQKNSLSLIMKSKANKGKGRFSFSAFSTLAKWITKYNNNGDLKSYTITLSDENKEEFEYETPQYINKEDSTGTTVVFYNIFGINTDDISFEALEDCLLKEFSWFLYLNKHKSLKLILNNKEIEYNKCIDSEFSETVLKNIDNSDFKISLIVWKEKIKEKFRSYYFDSNHSVKGIDTTTFNRNTVDFNHSVFIQSSFFNGWDKVSLFDFSTQLSFFHSEKDRKTLKKLKNNISKIKI